MMRIARQRRLFAKVAAITLVLALPAIAQQTRQRILTENPYRNIGGSCVYGRYGKLVYAPKGSDCPPQQDLTLEATGAAPSDRFKGLSSTLHADMVTLLEGHAHVANELAEVRRAVARSQMSDALRSLDHVVRKLTDHMAREEQLFEKLSAASAPQGS